MLRRVFFSFILLMLCGWVSAQPVPPFTGLSVEADGSVYAAWSIPSGSFDGFRLFYRIAGSSQPFNSIDFPATADGGSIPVNDAMTTGYEAFLVTYTAAGVSDDSERLRTMMLFVSNGGTGTGIARLDWNSMRQSGGNTYTIYKSQDGINYSQTATTNALIFYDTINFLCDPVSIYYRIEVSAGLTTAKSSVSSAIFKDDNLPADPVLSYVTIVNGLAEVNWGHSPTPDVQGYVIEVKEQGSYNHHVTTAYVNSFVDDLTHLPTYHDPCAEVVTYVLRALDQCGNSSSGAINYQHPHNTLLINGDTESLCHRKASLSWNAYNYLQPPVSEYKVMRSFNGAPAIEVGTVAAGSADSYSFVDDEILEPGGSYTYYIQAQNDDHSFAPESCRLLLIPEPKLLDFFHLNNLTVMDDSRIDLFFDGQPYPYIHEIEVQRSSDGFGPFQQLFSSPWEGLEQWWLPDITAQVNRESYYYRVIAFDRCGFALDTSLVMRSIFLELTDLGNGDVRLDWNAIEGWPEGPVSYQVYRFENDQLVAGYPMPLSPSVLSFNDRITGTELGVTTFYVEAERGDPFNVNSRSNKVTAEGEAEIVLPNAFRPGGINTVFRPLVKNVNPAEFTMLIYNRWGQLVYETHDFSAGWDGTFNGGISDTGIYAVIVKYSDFKGLTQSVIGSVMLLR